MIPSASTGSIHRVVCFKRRRSDYAVATNNTGETIAEPTTAFTRADYDFTGWYRDSDIATPAVFPITVTQNITLYAGWELSYVEPVFLSDAEYIIGIVEEVHPAFTLSEITDRYYVVRDEFLEKAADGRISQTDFLLATQRYFATLKDGHMGFGLFSGSFITADFVHRDGLLYYNDSEILSIGGVPIDEIKAVVREYYFAENQTGWDLFYAVFTRQMEMLNIAGAVFSGGNQITVATTTGTQILGFRASWFWNEIGSVGANYICRHEMMGDVFYVDLRSFTLGQQVDATAQAMERAVANGVTKFIIDVRGNGGGNSNVGDQLLRALGMRVPGYGMHTRFSSYLADIYGESPEAWGLPSGTAFFNHARNPGAAVQNKSINLAVLTDIVTYSSATMLGVWVQDGNLGTIIGSASMNAPNAFGNMLNFSTLEHGINFRVSTRRFLRPNRNAAPDTLWPDILTNHDEDALEVALEYLAN